MTEHSDDLQAAIDAHNAAAGELIDQCRLLADHMEQIDAAASELCRAHGLPAFSRDVWRFPANTQKKLAAAVRYYEAFAGQRYSADKQDPPVVGRLLRNPKTGAMETVSEDEFERRYRAPVDPKTAKANLASALGAKGGRPVMPWKR